MSHGTIRRWVPRTDCCSHVEQEVVYVAGLLSPNNKRSLYSAES
jgi:hypothetical protein